MLKARDVEAPTAPTEIFKDEHVTVRAVENTHYPVESKQRMPYRSIAVRFDTRDRSIVFSGDTAYSSGLVALAKGASVLVCEAMDVAAMRKAFDGMKARGMYADNPEGVWHHIVSTHTPLEVAGRMAAEAGVGTLVLTHIIPGALGAMPDSAYIAAVRKTFNGPVIVGHDQLVV
jgi:ribonuclease BN (tRNA processing enzyme)